MPHLDIPHRRFNPLTNEWVLVSPHRAHRPWLGQMEKRPSEALPAYDPDCYLCPGNVRAGGQRNPQYTATFVFDNDFPALLPPEQEFRAEEDLQPDPAASAASSSESLERTTPASGICRVVCFSPRHDLTIATLPPEAAQAVVAEWTEQTRQLASFDFVRYVQVFENRGAMMGASNPHPHSQIWATSFVPNEPAKEIAALRAYQQQHGACLLCDYLAAERRLGERLVVENEHFSALVPFWAVWPFELLVIARRHCGSLTDLSPLERAALAGLLQQVAARYDSLFETPFPYSMGFHQSPKDGEAHPECHLHAHYYPPLLRSATVRKFMVGFEMLAMPQRDVTPEAAAERLRSTRVEIS